MSKSKVYSTYLLVEVYDDDGEVIISTAVPGWGADCGDCDWEYCDEKWDSVTNELDFHWWTTHDSFVNCKTL